MEIVIHNNYCTLHHDKSREVMYFVGKYLTVTDYISRYDRYAKKYKREPQVETLYEYVPANQTLIFGRGVLDLISEDDKPYITLVDRTHDRLKSYDTIDRESLRSSVPGYILRDDQVMASYKALRRHRGIIQMPTGSGKSLIITTIANEILKNNPDAKIIICAPTVVTIDNIVNYLSKLPWSVSDYRRTKSSKEQIVVGHPKSLSKMDNLNEFDVVLWDEVQHLSCNTWKLLNWKLCNVSYNIGFSALVLDSTSSVLDISRMSASSASVISRCGSIIMNAAASSYIELNLLAKIVVFRAHDQIPNYLPDDEHDYAKIYNSYIESPERVQEVVKISKVFYEHQRRVLILTTRKSQAWSIADEISDDTDVVVSFGSGEGYVVSHHETSKLPESVSTFNNSQDYKVLIATTHLDEGADLSNLDVCILAGGGSKPRRIIQRVGRVLRKTKTGKYAYLIDFYGTNSGVLKHHSNLRLKLYDTELGVSDELMYKEIEVDQIGDKFIKLEGIGK